MSKLVSSNYLSSNAGVFQAIYPGVSQTVSLTSTSGSSDEFGAYATIARVMCTEDCFLSFGTDPTATTSDLFLPANTVEYFGVLPGSKIAAIRSASDGTLYITEGV